MTKIDVFYQAEGIPELGHVEVDADQTFAALKSLLSTKHSLAGELLIFVEDGDEPIQEVQVLREHAGPHGIKAHLHRCRHVEVAVTFNGETVHHQFGPGATIARVKRWAAEHKFGMSKEDA